MYDLHRLRLLRELKVRGTLAAVAEALGYSPSAVSHQLATLEREVRAPLTEPFGRGVRLTPAAEMLVAHTETILIELERAEASVAASRTDVTGEVRIATFQTAAHTLIPAAIAALAAGYPQLTVSVSHVNAEAGVPGLVARDFDVVLAERYPGEVAAPLAGVSTDVLLTDRLLLAVPEAWPAGRLADLAEAPWVMENPGTGARAWATRECRHAGFDPRVTIQSADVYLHARLVERGLAAAMIPALSLASPRRIRVTPLGQDRVIELSVRTGSQGHPGIAAVREALQAAALGVPSDRW